MQNLASKSPEKKEKQKKSVPFQADTIIDMDGNVIKEPDYRRIRLSKDQQTEIFSKVEDLWT